MIPTTRHEILPSTTYSENVLTRSIGTVFFLNKTLEIF
jgi:hypothetical protein